MLSGARVVRIATHPDYARVCRHLTVDSVLIEQMGYGTRAIEAINSFYSGEMYNYDDALADMSESFADAARIGPVRVQGTFLKASLIVFP
jgi:N-acetyltransferase 10